VPAGEPVFGSSLRNRQLLGDDLENTTPARDTPRDSQPPPGHTRAGDRRSGLALRAPPPQRPPGQPLGVTYVPRHERHIT
jgi:hypothetical protein